MAMSYVEDLVQHLQIRARNARSTQEMHEKNVGEAESIFAAMRSGARAESFEHAIEIAGTLAKAERYSRPSSPSIHVVKDSK